MTENIDYFVSPDDESLEKDERTPIKIVIVSEDTFVVKEYFVDKLAKLPLWQNAKVKYEPKVLNCDREPNQPKDIENKIKKYIQRDEPLDADSYWLIIDRDIVEFKNEKGKEKGERKLDELSEFCKNSKETEGVKINLANTNPCFAFWLFLHYRSADDPLINKCNECKPIETVLTSQDHPFQILKNEGKELKRNKTITFEMLKTAVKHAQEIDLSEYQPDDWLKNPRQTHVHRIFIEHLPQVFE